MGHLLEVVEVEHRSHRRQILKRSAAAAVSLGLFFRTSFDRFRVNLADVLFWLQILDNGVVGVDRRVEVATNACGASASGKDTCARRPDSRYIFAGVLENDVAPSRMPSKKVGDAAASPCQLCATSCCTFDLSSLVYLSLNYDPNARLDAVVLFHDVHVDQWLLDLLLNDGTLGVGRGARREEEETLRRGKTQGKAVSCLIRRLDCVLTCYVRRGRQ